MNAEGIMRKHGHEPAADGSWDTAIDAALADRECYQELYAMYVNDGEMPYGIAKARDGDPDEWMFHRLEQTLP
jgi:hypothetical protein